MFTTLKRTIFLCVFFVLLSCQPASDKSQHQVEESPQPLLTLNELLSAKDVKVQLAQAAKHNDQEKLKELQKILISAADEVFLAPKERELIAGPNGLIFLEYQGMRFNFQAEFEQAFFEFGDVEAVYEKYPAFEQLQAQSQALVENRDLLIESIEADLIAQGSEGDTQAQARLVWQEMMRQRDNANNELPDSENNTLQNE